tara:strand:+ start:969 stop:1133 length:165 start_codon:yes stop_codon:yes gene_type:complete
VQGFLNQQPFKAGAIDKEVTFNQLATGQSERFNIAIIVLQNLRARSRTFIDQLS